MKIAYDPIGTIRTSYDEGFAPTQPVERDTGESRIVLEEEWAPALADLSSFGYIYVLFHLDRTAGRASHEVAPPWAGGRRVGLFASRSPHRPNPIGLSIVRLKRIEGNVLVTSPIDAYDATPVLDIKPYIRGLDSKEDADTGWIAGMEGGEEHILAHIRGIPHDHGHEDHPHHDHDHDHHDER